MREGAMIPIMHPLLLQASPQAPARRMQSVSRMTFTLLVVILSALVILEIALNHRQQLRGIIEARREGRRLTRFPSISMIRPIRGADVGAAENFAAALDNGYPGEIETLFVFDDELDPGYPIAVAA